MPFEFHAMGEYQELERRSVYLAGVILQHLQLTKALLSNSSTHKQPQYHPYCSERMRVCHLEGAQNRDLWSCPARSRTTNNARNLTTVRNVKCPVARVPSDDYLICILRSVYLLYTGILRCNRTRATDSTVEVPTCFPEDRPITRVRTLNPEADF